MDYSDTIETAGEVIDAIGVILIVVGAAIATFRFTQEYRARQSAAYRNYRLNLGRAILIGLEFLVAGDIIRTVAIDPTFEDLGILAAIVGIRTFLSFSLEVEITGRWPWQPAAEGESESP